MTPYHDTRASRIHDGPAELDSWDVASVGGAVCGIKAITGILLHHHAHAECDGDDLLQLNGASVGGLLEAVGGLAELIGLRLDDGTRRVRRARRQGGEA